MAEEAMEPMASAVIFVRFFPYFSGYSHPINRLDSL
jgi:hypothetical protein